MLHCSGILEKVVGFFSRDKDESDDAYAVDQPVDQPVAAPAPPPSVDGVLPPGVNPQPAPASHNLASQINMPTPVSPDPVVSVTQPSDQSLNVEDSAGDYIMTAPPIQSDPAPIAEPEHEIEVAYEGLDTEPAQESVQEPVPSQEPLTDTQPLAEEFFTPEPETTIENEPPAVTAASSEDDLATIKQQALTQLTSLAGHLDQSPEEKFHTTMMMLQATDDKALIKTAYEAAQSITDEKTRAQALLDIVNEINYFNQK